MKIILWRSEALIPLNFWRIRFSPTTEDFSQICSEWLIIESTNSVRIKSVKD